MAPANSEAEILQAWHALKHTHADSASGWQTIGLEPARLHCRAGIHFPGGEEAVIAGFPLASSLPATDLPKGRGFDVSHITVEGAGGLSYALSRQPGADTAMFLVMVLDVLDALRRHENSHDQIRLRLFIQRVRSWQAFMERHGDRVLGPEAEIGLHGELVVLKFLLLTTLDAITVIDAWKGPLDGLHDFEMGTTAVEVKTTATANGFPARISSLEQLDDAFGVSIILPGIRLAAQETGFALPERVQDVRALIAADGNADALFSMKLLQGGYIDSAAEKYSKRFAHVDTRMFTVGPDFPRFARSTSPTEIRQATYDLDLDLLRTPALPLEDLTKLLGIQKR